MNETKLYNFATNQTDLLQVVLQDKCIGMVCEDIDDADGLIIIHCPFLTSRKVTILRPTLQRATERGVVICVFYQKPRRDMAEDRLEDINSALRILCNLGVHLNEREKIHEKLMVVDNKILWEGSLNILSHYDSLERMNRWVSGEKVREAVKTHKLDECGSCTQLVGFNRTAAVADRDTQIRQMLSQDIVARRKELGISQAELARLVGVSQATISLIESGRVPLIHDSTAAILCGLDMTLRTVRWNMIPAIDRRLGR